MLEGKKMKQDIIILFLAVGFLLFATGTMLVEYKIEKRINCLELNGVYVGGQLCAKK